MVHKTLVKKISSLIRPNGLWNNYVLLHTINLRKKRTSYQGKIINIRKVLDFIIMKF